MTGKKVLFISLFCLTFFAIGVVSGCARKNLSSDIVAVELGGDEKLTLPTYYQAFQNKNEKPHAAGTIDEALLVMKKIMEASDFTWDKGSELGQSSLGSFGRYDIRYKGVSMDLSPRDYSMYRSYLKGTYEKARGTEYRAAPWHE